MNYSDRQQPVANVIDASRFGLTGDGLRDDTPALQAALNAAVQQSPANVLIPKPPHEYRITTLTIKAPNVGVILDPTTVIRKIGEGRASESMLEIAGGLAGAESALTKTVPLGGDTLEVADASGFHAGDWVEVVSSTKIKGQGPYLYEIVSVAKVEDGRLGVSPLRNGYDITHGSVVVRVVRLLAGVSVTGGVWEGAGGDAGDCIRIRYALAPRVSRVTVRKFGNFGIALERCRGGLFDSCLAYGGTNERRSWAMSLWSCSDVMLEACTVRDTPWDGFNLSYGTMHTRLHACRAVDVGDVGFVIGHGVHGHDNVISECVSIRSGAAGFAVGDPSYEGDDANVFHLCQAWMCKGGGFQVRRNSRGNYFQGCRALGNGGSGFATESPSDETVISVSESSGNEVHGVSLESRAILVGGWFHGNKANGIRLSGAASSTIVGVVAEGNGSHGIAITARSDDTSVVTATVRRAGAGADGVFVGDSKNVLLWGVTALDNPRCGIEVYAGTEGASKYTRVLRPSASGNGRSGVCAMDSGARMLARGDSRPSVAEGGAFQADNSEATVITDFRDGRDGQAIYVRLDSHTTVRSGPTLILGGGDYVGPGRGWLVLWHWDGAWRELGRDVP